MMRGRHSLRPALVVAIFTGLLLAIPALGHAQAADAEALVQSGIELRRQQRDEEALAAFRRAWQIAPSPRIRAQIGVAEQALGHWADAALDLREALAATNDTWIEAHRAALASAQQSVTHHVGYLEVRSNVPAELWVGGHRIATLPMREPVFIVAGTSAVQVRAEGCYPVQRMVDVLPGETTREMVELIPRENDTTAPHSSAASGTSASATSSHSETALAPVAVRQPTSTAPPVSMTRLVPPLAVMAVGAVGLGISAGFYFGLAEGALHGCTVTGQTAACDTQSDANTAMNGTTYDQVAIGLLIGGAVLLAGGTAWLAAKLNTGQRSHAALHVVPTFGRGAGLVAGGTF